MTVENNESVPNNTNDFDNTINEIKDLYHRAFHSRQFRSGADRIQIDSKWTNLFQRLNWHGNSVVLSGFKLRLEMDEESERKAV